VSRPIAVLFTMARARLSGAKPVATSRIAARTADAALALSEERDEVSVPSSVAIRSSSTASRSSRPDHRMSDFEAK
jgi:hypothetical protein